MGKLYSKGFVWKKSFPPTSECPVPLREIPREISESFKPTNASSVLLVCRALRATSVMPFLLLSSSSRTIIGRKMSCSSKRKRHMGSCIKTLVSSTKSFAGPEALGFLFFLVLSRDAGDSTMELSFNAWWLLTEKSVAESSVIDLFLTGLLEKRSGVLPEIFLFSVDLKVFSAETFIWFCSVDARLVGAGGKGMRVRL